eukprot:g6570.t2
MAAKGFGRGSSGGKAKTKVPGGGGGFGAQPVSSKKPAAAATSRVRPGTKQPTSGATVQEQVMRQTEESIRRSMDKLKTTRPLVWEALELKKKLARWHAQTAGLNILQLNELPPQQVQEMKGAEAQLRSLQLAAAKRFEAFVAGSLLPHPSMAQSFNRRMGSVVSRAVDEQHGATTPQPPVARGPDHRAPPQKEEHGIGDRLLHNIAQEATWDASARVKDERQENVQLPPSAVEHMQSLIKRSEVGADSRVMDVGSGTGILLRFLQGAGVEQANLVGVDLSSAMVAVASERYPQATFVQADFLDYCEQHGSSGDSDRFSHVFFNGCLHNFLEPGEALAGAALLLKEGGKIIISHPKGAANVDMQRRSNPMLVPNRLPTEADLEKACDRIPSLKMAGVRVVQAAGGVASSGYLQIDWLMVLPLSQRAHFKGGWYRF